MIEEIKNKNYKMHKSKKGWLISYSVLTFMLGSGAVALINNTSAVEAAEVESQPGESEAASTGSDTQAVNDAKLAAINTLLTTTNSAEQRINSDRSLTHLEKAKQVKNASALFDEAKSRINAATDITSVKTLLDSTVSSINSSYQPVPLEFKAAARKTNVPKVNKPKGNSLKSFSAKRLSTYSGLNNFLKSGSTTKSSKRTVNKLKDYGSLIDTSMPSSTSVDIPANEITTDILGAKLADNSISKNSANESNSEVEVTPRAIVAAGYDATKNVTVGADPDSNRDDFNKDVDKPAGSTPTSMNIATPDQITNPDKYKQKVVNVADFNGLAAAWTDASVTYINITSDISYTGGTIGNRAAGASVVVNGNGHTIDLNRQTFSYVGVPYSNLTTVTITNGKFQQGFPGNDGDSSSLVYSSNGAGLKVNIDNVTLSSSTSNGYNPIHVLMANGSKITFSGNNVFNISNEVTRGVGMIDFANNGHVTMNRTSNDIRFSEFYMSYVAPQASVGYGNQITMGDGSSNTAYTYNGTPANYPAMYNNINGVTVGDNVKWTQTGFQYFLNGTQGGNSVAQYKFGQNFNLSAPVTTQPNAIRLWGTQRAVFNAGTTFDINQRYNDSVIRVNDSSSVTFISPKQLHLAIQDGNGNPVATGAGIISGAGTVSLNNSNIKTWLGNNSQTNSTAGDNTAKFAQMVVRNGQATVTDLNGTTAVSNIVTPTTRELQTIAIPVGKVNVQYVDQNGKNVGLPVELNLGSDAYIGKYLPLITSDVVVKNMPRGYMWALGNQIFPGAKADAQSGGDPTTEDDNGDSFGQAAVGLTPMEGDTYTYKVYVYGTKQNVTYQYVDVNHKDRILTSPLSGQTGKEAIGNLVPANYGNTIDWTDKYYTEDNVPAGYHYAKGAASQPTTTKVSEINPVVTIYVEGNPQKISPTYVDMQGNTLNPDNLIEINGVTGQSIKVPTAPDVKNWAPDHVEINGQSVPLGSVFEIGNGTDTIVYRYHSLAIEKEAAIQAIDAEATKVKGEIEADPTLNNNAKQEQKTAVDKAATDAKANINQAEYPSGVEKAKQDGITAIDAAHVAGIALDQQKKDYSKQIDDEATKIKGEIDADVTLDDETKVKQKGDVDKDATAAKDAIKQATDVQTAENAMNDGIVKIDGDHIPGSVSLPDQKKAALAAIEAEATKVKGEIDADSTLDDDTKKKQKGDVDKDAADAKTAINNALNAQQVKNAKEEGIIKIDGDHVSGNISLPDQKNNAQKAIDDEAAKVKGEIDADVTLDTATKNKQKADVDRDAAAAKDKINSATTAQGVIDAKNEGIAKIDADHVPGSISLPDQKTNAIAAIEAEATKVKAEIEADPTLDDQAKKAQKNAVDIDAAAAKVNINKATNAQGVNDARDAGIVQIDSDHIPGNISLPDQKANAVAAINNEATKVKGEIDADPTLDSTEKAAQKAKVDKDATIAKNNINQASDAQSVKEAEQAGIIAIDADHIPGNISLPDQKKNAQKAIDDEAAKIKGEIDADPTLDSTEKAAQKANVDKDAADAKTAIKNANDAQGVKDATDDGIKKIDADHIPGNISLPDQKKNAQKAIDDEAAKIKGEIDADPTLDSTEKAVQKANVDKDAAAAKEAIKNATDAQGVKDATDDGIKKIDADHIPGNIPLPDQKKNAKAAIDAEATKVKGEIDADPTLDDATKAKQKTNVDTEATIAKTAIDNATDSQGVKNARDEGIIKIDAQHVSNGNLANQKAKAVADIDEEVLKVKKQIANDTSLDSKAKNAQNADVDAAADIAKTNIQNATEVQNVLDARDRGITNIDAQYVTNPITLEQQKEHAKQLVTDEAKIVSTSINNDPVLDQTAKAQQIQTVEDQKQKALDKIDQAANADAVQIAYNEGISAIHAQHVGGTDLTTQKQTAKDELVQEATTTKAAINKDVRLNKVAKAQQLLNIDHELEKAQNAVDRATTAQEINDQETAGLKAINAQYVPGKPLDEQKADANKAIDDAVSAAKDKIDQDKSKTDAEKQKDKQAVDNAANAAKDAINNAQTADEIDDAKNNGINQINKIVADGSGKGTNNSGGSSGWNGGSGSNGTNGSNGANGSNGSNAADTTNGSNGSNAADKPLDKSKASPKVLLHNAYFYNKEGKRANLLIAKKGSTITTYGTEKINDRQFYRIDEDLYIAVNNTVEQRRSLQKNAFVYNRQGKRIGKNALKKNLVVSTYGDPVKIHGKAYYMTSDNHYVKARNFGSVLKEARNVLAENVNPNADILHDSYVYDATGKRVGEYVLLAGSRATTGETKTINGKNYIAIGDGHYVASGNITGTARRLKTTSFVYSEYGHRLGRKVLRKNKTIQTYGSVVKIHGKSYFTVGHNEFVKKANF
ncbi:DUF1542 domain-containing protein [Lactobacillus xylocopicola]|nr:DUF1542 domain-containing protein [Lactobacillus xylocopicola]